jgi:hypothetical protein
MEMRVLSSLREDTEVGSFKNRKGQRLAKVQILLNRGNAVSQHVALLDV